MKKTEIFRYFEGIKDYRTFLVDLCKQFMSTGVLYRELKMFDGIISIALKVRNSIHNFISKQHAVCGKIFI